MSESSFKIDRRKFLAMAATLGFAGALYRFREIALESSPSKTLNRLRAGHYHFGPQMTVWGYYFADQYKSRAIFEWNLETGKTELFETRTAVHVIETSPVDKNLSVLATKRTDRMSMFDWASKKEISTSQLMNGDFYYGHAVFTADGRFLVTSTIDRDSRGFIDVLEVPSLKKIASHPVTRGVAHEILELGDSKFVFCVGNSAETRPAFGTIDLSNSEFEYFDVPDLAPQKSLTMTHLKDCGDRYVANVNIESREGLLDGAVVSLMKSDNSVKTEISMASHGLESELLSFEYDPIRRFMWVTVPDKSLIVVWNLATDSLVKEIRLPRGPLSVSFVPSLDLVIVAARSKFFAFDPRTIERRETFEAKAPNSLLSGGKTSHSRLV